ncbi:MAG: DUF4876 domain-containing protein [Bacteroidales bacterium]
MKNRTNIFLLIVVALFTFSCENLTDLTNTKRVEGVSANISVTLNLGDAPTPQLLNVKMINYNENYELTTTMTPGEPITVDNIIPGIYTVTLTGEEYQDGFAYNYSGSVVNIDIIDRDKAIDVNVGASKSGALVFKEIYYCGSRTPSNGSYFRDQFYEIYNNSESTQNVRGLSIATINPLTATANLPIWEGEDADKYVYCITIWQVPDDRDYPVEPGESIIIAQMADNHQRDALNPSSPVNLLSAEFETYVNTTAIIQDNPAINMKMAFWPSPTPQWLTTVFGAAFVLFYPDGEIDPNSTTEVVSPQGLTTKNYRIPIDNIVDAVEAVNTPNHIQLKRMPVLLDAGAVTTDGTYNGKSLARKIKETLPDGRNIYFDTNNSSEDFELMESARIRRYGAKAPAWNTWK